MLVELLDQLFVLLERLLLLGSLRQLQDLALHEFDPASSVGVGRDSAQVFGVGPLKDALGQDLVLLAPVEGLQVVNHTQLIHPLLVST